MLSHVWDFPYYSMYTNPAPVYLTTDTYQFTGQLSQFEIEFSTSTRCLCVFIRPAFRHAMLLKCANLYYGTGHSNTKYNTKYKCFDLGSLRDTLCSFAKVKRDLTTQLSLIITGLLTPNFACNVEEYFKDDRPSQSVNPRMHYVVLTVTSSECLKLYLNPCELSWWS